MVKAQIILYCGRLEKIGGIETFTKNFIKAFKNTYNMAVVWEERIDEGMEAALLQMVPVYRRSGNDFECDTVICNNIIPDTVPTNIKYKRKIQMLHGTMLQRNWKIPECDVLVPVSQHAFYTFECDRENVEVINNITCTEKPKKVLRLVTISRLSADKGAERMAMLATHMKNHGIPFVWTVFSNGGPETMKMLEAAGLTIVGAVKDGRNYIPGNDYLVQLSDDEAYCYSIVEALELKVPVLTTPIGSLEEIGFVDGEHGHIIPFDVPEECVEKIYENIPSVVYKSKTAEIKKKWKKLLNLEPEKSEYKCLMAESIRRYTDIYKNRVIEEGERFPIAKDRFEYLRDKGFVKEAK